MNTKKYLLTFAVAVSSVVSTYFVTISTAQQGTQTAPATADNEYQVAAVLYQQHAAEYRALAFQAFNLAKLRLDEDFDKKNLKKLSKEERKKTRAVVVDIDETVLDNSPHNAYLVKSGFAYSDSTWENWVGKHSAKPIPGAIEFLQHAKDKGVRIFYVSNRANSSKSLTIQNLNDLKFPDVSDETVKLKIETSEKEPRRNDIKKDYRIVLLIGDNLDDFSADYEKKSVAERFTTVNTEEKLFGSQYIVLPNAMYGTWERALYDYKNLEIDAKKQKQFDLLESYK